jgi:hypothetical protein
MKLNEQKSELPGDYPTEVPDKPVPEDVPSEQPPPKSPDEIPPVKESPLSPSTPGEPEQPKKYV